jgi:hypothetical protein
MGSGRLGGSSSQMCEIGLMTTVTLIFGEAAFFVAIQIFRQAWDLSVNNLLPFE